MSQTAIVVEDGVIQCEHGGKVVLTSSEAVHVIGGKKPLHDIDLMGAPIQGCPYYAPVGGNCTSVASITSAVTEENVSAGGLKYLLRTDGCKTDKGAALVLVDPGQTNSIVPAKSGGSAGNVTAKALEDAKVDTKENIKKEKYRIHPLRKSNGKLRALRGARDFKVHKNFYVTNDYTHEKVITKTDAYLYVTHDDKTMEYKVINRGDSSNPVIQKVQFKDEEGAIRKHIPFYKDEGTMEIIYSNIQLSEEDRKHFTPSIITIGSKKNAYVQHHKNYSNTVKHEEKAIKKIFISQSEAKKLNKAYLNIVIPLDDPIGEVEDLYHEMESSFYRAYAHNKSFIDKVKERNAYAYGVANFMDEIELNAKEKKERVETKKKLQEAYYTLVEGLKEEFLPYIKQVSEDRKSTWTMKDSSARLIRLNAFIEHDVAMSYLNEVRLNAAFLLNSKSKGGRRGNRNFEYYNAFDGRRVEYLKEQCVIEKNSHDYLCLGKGTSIDGANTKYKYEESIRTSRTTITALTLFSLYFSGKHSMSLKGKYQDAAEDFHYNLKKLKAHPEFDDKVQEDINDKLADSPYKHLFKNASGVRKDTFIDDYANLDTTARYCAFTWKEKGHIKEFDTLVPKKESFDFYFSKTQKSPETFSKELKAKLKNPELKKVLEKYTALEKKDFESVQLLLNIAYSLTASRTSFDEEVTQTSPFNTGSGVTEFIKALSFTLQGVDAKEHEKLYEEEIFTRYHQSLHSLINHALVEGRYNADDFGARAKNTQTFLSAIAPETEKEYPLDLTQLNDGNISKDLKVKQAHEKLFEQLKALDGITSQIHGAEDKQRAHEKEMKGTDKQKKIDKANANLVDDGLTSRDEKERAKIIRKSKPYKVSISNMKGLSFFISLFTTGEALKNYNKNDIKALLDITTGINSITKTVVETGTKVLPRTKQAMMMVDFLLAEDSLPQRIIAKLAIPAIIIGAYYEAEALDNEDYDAMVAITTKAAITIALAFVSGFWIAAAGYIALEILWYVFSSYFVDSRVEIMIERSLFYESGIYGRRSYMLSSLETGNGFYLIKRGYKDAPLQAKNIHSIGNPKVVREFIYKNYAANKKDFIAAARYEFSSIFRVLKGIKIDAYKKPFYLPNEGASKRANISGYLSVNKEYFNDINGIYLLEDDKIDADKLIETDECKIKDEKTRDNLSNKDDVVIDLFKSFRENRITIESMQAESKKKYSILIDSKETSVKFDLDIRYSFIDAPYQDTWNLYLDDINEVPLSDDDLKQVKEKG